jgi:hypothetical protein
VMRYRNQFAAAKDVASIKDEFGKSHSCRIEIIDRAWITEKVYNNGHLSMAIDALGIEGAQAETIQKHGSRDAARSVELAELDKQIADTNRYQHARFQLASDCLHSAVLARSLGRPRAEIEARFEQAIRIADEIGRTSQSMRIRYNYAWTAFWWFEDLRKFLEIYNEVEDRLNDSAISSEVKHLYTLWSLAASSVQNGRLEAQVAKIDQRQRTLSNILKPLAEDLTRPNNALEAQTYLAMMRMHNLLHIGSEEELAECWQEFERILNESKPLGDYPFEMLESILKVGSVIDSPEFDNLYAKLVVVIGQRQNEGSAGKAYVNRAFQKLEHDIALPTFIKRRRDRQHP